METFIYSCANLNLTNYIQPSSHTNRQAAKQQSRRKQNKTNKQKKNNTHKGKNRIREKKNTRVEATDHETRKTGRMALSQHTACKQASRKQKHDTSRATIQKRGGTGSREKKV